MSGFWLHTNDDLSCLPEFSSLASKRWTLYRKVCAMLWALWKARNNLVFNKDSRSEVICRQAEAYFKEYRNPIHSSHDPEVLKEVLPAGIHHWIPPPVGVVKINVDGACGEGHAAAGAIVRDHLGGFIGCASKVLDTTYAINAEAEAFMLGVKLIRDLHLSNVIIEGDAKVIIDSINKAYDCQPWRIQNTIRYCQNLLLQRDDISFSFAPRLANGVAHALAKFSIIYDATNVWSGGLPPPPLLDIFNDLATIQAYTISLPARSVLH